MSATIQAVLFDFGLVLSGPPNPAAWHRMHTTLAFDPDRFHHEYWVRRHNYDRGDLSGSQYWQAIAAEAGYFDLTSDTLKLLEDADTDLWTDLNEPMFAWAQDLQQRGIRTGILSNIGDSMQAGIERKLPAMDRFHHRTWSHSLGIAKPEPAIYAHAAEGLATPISRILFIDDRAVNIAAARQAGMQAIQYTGWTDFLTAMHAAGYDDLLSRSEALSS